MDWSNWESLSDEEKLKRRVWLTVNTDKETQLLLRALSKQDPIFFIEAFCWTFNPQKNPSRIPFILYPFQRNLIYWLESKLKNKESGLIEKSRQMGITWVLMCWLFYHWMFDEGFTALIGSRKEELVDKRGKSDTLFEKLDYNLRYVPRWIIPKKYEPLKDRRHLIIVNPNVHSVIYGESANKDFGRGATLSVAFLDEFASWGEAESSWNSVSEATAVKIPVSTPKAFSYFKALRFSNQLDVKTVHWKEHPERGEKWYAKQLETKSSETVAQEIDISYDVTGRGKVYEEIDLVEVGKYPYNPKWPIYTATDYGLKDQTAILWVQQNPETQKVYVIDCYWNEDKTIDFYVPFYTGIITPELNSKYSYTFSEKQQIKEHLKWKKPRHFGDPAGKQRGQVTNTSVIRELSKAGIFVFTNDKANSFPARREATKMLLRVLYINKTKQNDYFLECIKQSRYPERNTNSQATTAVTKPVHDWTCTAGDTKIRTLKGWIPIKNLVKEKEIWLWAYSKKEKKLVPTKAHSARITGQNVPMLEIGLDNGNSIKCTPEHKFMLRNENWIEAKDLKKGDSLMPFYEKNDGGYMKIDLNNGSVAFEHRYIYHKIYGMPPLGYHIDHIDESKTNNYPENLQALSPQEHCSKTHKGKSISKRRLIGKEQYKNISDRNKIYRNCAYCNKEFLTNYKQFYCSKKCRQTNYKKNNSREKRYKRDPNYKKISKQSAKNFESTHKHPCQNCSKQCYRRAIRCRRCNILKIKNHKVRYIKQIKNSKKVYDLIVPKYHNFVAEGIILHNSHFRSALEYLAVNLGIKRAKPRKINYLKKNITDKETGKIKEPFKEQEKKRKIIRYSFRSY